MENITAKNPQSPDILDATKNIPNSLIFVEISKRYHCRIQTVLLFQQFFAHIFHIFRIKVNHKICRIKSTVFLIQNKQGRGIVKTITKLIWGMFSAAICVMYKWNAFGACSYYLLSTVLVTKTSDQSYEKACDAKVTAMGWGGAENALYDAYLQGRVSHLWTTALCRTNATGEHFTTYLPLDAATTQTTICAKGKYLYSCSDGAGTVSNIITATMFRSGWCKTNIICNTCPPHTNGNYGTTTSAIMKNTYNENRSYADGGKFMLVCSTAHPTQATTTADHYLYFIGLVCPAADTRYEYFNSIGDCYMPAPVIITDTTGVHSCTDATGNYVEAYYRQ